MMGYDAWSDGGTQEEYLTGCRSSQKYRLGTWYVLVVGDRPVSSLISYHSHFGLPARSLGIGSVSTRPDSRGQGFASTLIRKFVAHMESEQLADAFFLHSDIGTGLYEKLGFRPLPRVQQAGGAVCMVKAPRNWVTTPDFTPPTYF